MGLFSYSNHVGRVGSAILLGARSCRLLSTQVQEAGGRGGWHAFLSTSDILINYPRQMFSRCPENAGKKEDIRGASVPP